MSLTTRSIRNSSLLGALVLATAFIAQGAYATATPVEATAALQAVTITKQRAEAIALQAVGFVPSVEAERLLDRIDILLLGVYFVIAAALFFLSFRRAPSGVLRQQLKWVAGGTASGILPFLLVYILPY